MLRWKEGSKLTTSAACYLALEVTDNMVFFKTTAKLYQMFLSTVQFEFCLKGCIFHGTRCIKIRKLSCSFGGNHGAASDSNYILCPYRYTELTKILGKSVIIT